MNKTIRRKIFSSDSQVWPLAVLTFLFVFCSRLIFIFQGFDMTDEGCNLTTQWLLINGRGQFGYNYHNPMIWLSSLAGGAWLKIGGGLGLVWARLGWATIIGLTGLAAFLILSRYFHPFASFVAVLAASSASIYHGTMTITYNNFPALILICAAGFLLVSQETASFKNAHNNRQMLFAILGGILLGFGVMARFPLILSLSLPFLPPLGHALFERNIRPSRSCWVKAFVSLVAAFMGILACLFLLHMKNHLMEYLNMIYSGVFARSASSLHHPASLLYLYCSTGMRAAIWGTLILASGFVIACAVAHICYRLKWHRIIAIALFGCLFFGLVYYLLGGPGRAKCRYFNALPGICFVLAALELFLAGLCSTSLTKKQINKFVLLAMGLFVAFFILLGNGNGIMNAKYGIWLLFPTVFLLIPEIIVAIAPSFFFEKLSREKIKYNSKNKISNQIIQKYAIVAMFAVALIGMCIQITNPHRELRNRLQLTTQPEDMRLRGIFTSSGRAASTNQLMEELNRLVEPGDLILAYNSIPMIHYLTQTVPALGHPWPSHMMPDKLKKKLDSLWHSDRPSLVIRAITNTRDRNWGDQAASRAFNTSLIINLGILDESVQRHGYREVWSNRDFVIYAPS